MSDLQKMKDDKLDLFIEHIKKELDGLEFKLQVGPASGFSYEAKSWSKYHYFLTVLLQEAKEEKRRRTKSDSKRINKRTTKD
jgi:hypothetical protein